MEASPELITAWVLRVERRPPGRDGECLIWTGPYDQDGYGLMKFAGQMRRAHRVAWVVEHGSIPDSLHVHHTCETPACVNLGHLAAVTPKEHANIHERRPPEGSWDKAADWQRRKTHCPKGHPYAGDNLHIRPCGRRKCRACDRERAQRRYEAKAVHDAA